MPQRAVRSRRFVVLWTPVPEASIDENGDPCRRKQDVGTALQSGHGSPVDSETKTAPVEFGP